MIDYEDALAQMLASMPLSDVENVPLHESEGRVLASDVCARWHHPFADVSAMDGYALAHQQQGSFTVTQVGEIAAGQRWHGSLDDGQAARIYTGGVMPAGSDSVIPIEDSVADDDGMVHLTPSASYWRRECFVRQRGLDFKEGAIVLRAGRRLTSYDIALAAAAGHDSVSVRTKPVIACVATGDELLQPHEARAVHEREPQRPIVTPSSLYGIMAMMRAHGSEPRDWGIAPDDPDELRKRLDEMARSDASILVTTGGVSQGAHDVMAWLCRHDCAIECLFSGVAVRPGKPLSFMIIHGKPLVALPGNPVSAMVGACVFLLPLLAAAQGCKARAWSQGRLGRDLPSNGKRLAFLRGRLRHDSKGRSWLFPYRGQDSAMLRLMSLSDVLIRREKNAPPQGRGVLVSFLPLA